MSEAETQIFRAAYRYFAAHPSPPPMSDQAASLVWWETAANDIAAVSASWNNHPLIIRLLAAIYEYLEEKAKEAAHELPQKP
ncbi:MAG: hypothetical protein ACI4MK_13465 [Aristaeellaceae bacterium]